MKLESSLLGNEKLCAQCLRPDRRVTSGGKKVRRTRDGLEETAARKPSSAERTMSAMVVTSVGRYPILSRYDRQRYNKAGRKVNKIVRQAEQNMKSGTRLRMHEY